MRANATFDGITKKSLKFIADGRAVLHATASAPAGTFDEEAGAAEPAFAEEEGGSF
jgi:hypothetical protein